MHKTSICVKVQKKQGEKTIAVAMKLGLLDKSLKIQRDEENLCIPLVRQPQEDELKTLKSQMPGFLLETKALTEKQPHARTLMQALENKLPPPLLVSLPQALDMVGDIAIVEIPPELKPHGKVIGEAILETHKNLKTVLAKSGVISGTFRLRGFDFIAGEHRTQTIHREFGCQYRVDLAKAFFSPRLSHEHMRVASLVEPGETVVDLFAGVGPFSVLIGKNKPGTKVYAVDINPEAIELLKVNVAFNRVENRVFPMLGDAKHMAATKLKGIASRLIMNLPETSIEFVDAACQAIKPQGGIIHFYAFVRSPDSVENLKLRFCQAVEETGRKVNAFLYCKSIRETAPYESQIVLDAKIA
ncbi:MAG TPA: class I SAM-dependent methyltransferase family protein [Candidatus Limnocylindrales bacterium]|nr:class I SAM-dependent methyltransferase family protein [Candidatus Limnocylindrales bacterium]